MARDGAAEPAASLNLTSANTRSSRFCLDWRTVPGDLIWDRVYSKFLNTWLIFIGLNYLLTMTYSGLLYWIPNPYDWIPFSSWFATVVSYALILFCGIVGTVIILPFTYANGHDIFKQRWWAQSALLTFPLLSVLLFTLYWVYEIDMSRAYGSLLYWQAGTIAAGCCFFYCVHVMMNKNCSYQERKDLERKRYVAQLLRRRGRTGRGGRGRGAETGAETGTAASTNDYCTYPIMTMPWSNQASESPTLENEKYEVNDTQKSRGADAIHQISDSGGGFVSSSDIFKYDTIEWFLHPIFMFEAQRQQQQLKQQPSQQESVQQEGAVSMASSVSVLERRTQTVQPRNPKDAFIISGQETHDTLSAKSLLSQSTLINFLVRLWCDKQWRVAVVYDIRKHTGQLLLLGGLLSLLFLSAMVGYTFKYVWIQLTWAQIYRYVSDATQTVDSYINSVIDLSFYVQVLENATMNVDFNNHQPRNFTALTANETYAIEQIDYYLQELGYNVSLESIITFQSAAANLSAAAQSTQSEFAAFSGNYFNFMSSVSSYEDDYNLLRDSWNYSLVASVVISALLMAGSIVWPLLTAANTRYNLRTGRWRLNRSAYATNYKIHQLTEVPGVQFGTTVINYVLVCLSTTVVFFLVVYGPIRKLIWQYAGTFFVSVVSAVVVKKTLVYLIFDFWQLDAEGHIRNMEHYSVCFCAMLFFNVAYGVFGAFLRILNFILYSVVANLRIDDSLLPPALWSLDDGFPSYNAYLLFEHETKNPVLRSGITAFAAGHDLPSSSSSSLSSFLACSSCSLLLSPSPSPVQEENEAANTGTSLRQREKKKCRCSLCDRVREEEGADPALAPVPVPTAASTARTIRVRARNKWLLAYTLLNNPSLVTLRRRKYTTQQEKNKKSKCNINSDMMRQQLEHTSYDNGNNNNNNNNNNSTISTNEGKSVVDFDDFDGGDIEDGGGIIMSVLHKQEKEKENDTIDKSY